jgi:hypothetical protein
MSDLPARLTAALADRYRIERELGAGGMAVIPSANPPMGSRRRWLQPQEFRTTAGMSFALSPDGRVVYVRGAAEVPVRYLRVILHWVDRMKRAVDAANR